MKTIPIVLIIDLEVPESHITGGKPTQPQGKSWFPISTRIPVTPANKALLRALRAAELDAWTEDSVG